MVGVVTVGANAPQIARVEFQGQRIDHGNGQIVLFRQCNRRGADKLRGVFAAREHVLNPAVLFVEFIAVVGITVGHPVKHADCVSLHNRIHRGFGRAVIPSNVYGGVGINANRKLHTRERGAQFNAHVCRGGFRVIANLQTVEFHCSGGHRIPFHVGRHAPRLNRGHRVSPMAAFGSHLFGFTTVSRGIFLRAFFGDPKHALGFPFADPLPIGGFVAAHLIGDVPEFVQCRVVHCKPFRFVGAPIRADA